MSICIGGWEAKDGVRGPYINMLLEALRDEANHTRTVIVGCQVVL
jgi:hypothetical protein